MLIAVDGPSGPRGHVELGIAALALRCRAAVVPVLPIASPRLRVATSWDRLQIPLPFARLRVHFGAPLAALPGEGSPELRDRIAGALSELELAHDPEEARRAKARAAAGSADPEGERG